MCVCLCAFVIAIPIYRESSIRSRMSDNFDDPRPYEPGAKYRQTVVPGSARCIFMIPFFLIGHRGKEEASSAGRNASVVAR